MAEESPLERVPDVEIDDGTFKYILMEVQVAGIMGHKKIVRGYRSAEFHNNIFDKVSPGLEALGLECTVLGGGKIQHERQNKKIRIFGESTGYGKADHSVTAVILTKEFKDYDVTWTDDKK